MTIAGVTMAGGLIAPWILESYEEAFSRLAVDLPILTTDPYTQAALVAATALVLFCLMWGAIGHLPARARIAARTLAAVPLLAPIAVFGAINVAQFDKLADHPGIADMVADATAAPLTPPTATPPTETSPVETAPTEATTPPQDAERTQSATERSTAASTVDRQTRNSSAGSSPNSSANSSANTQANSPSDSHSDALSQTTPMPAPEPTPGRLPDKSVGSISDTLAYLAGRPPTLPTPSQSPTLAPPPRETTLLFATNRTAKTDPQGASEFATTASGNVTLGRATLTLDTPAPQSAAAMVPVAAQVSAAAPLAAFTLGEQDFATLAVRQLVVSTRHPEQVLVFVHGYDTSFDDALRQGARFATELGFDGAVIIYSWPSTDDPRGYRTDALRADGAVPHLAAILRLLADSTNAKAVHIAAAGLGARTALGAIRYNLKSSPADPTGNGAADTRATDTRATDTRTTDTRATDTRATDSGANGTGTPARTATASKLGQLLLIAPDMDRVGLTKVAAEIASAVAGITLYASANDRALAVTRRDAGLVPRAGDVVENGPLLSPAIVTVDVTPASGERIASGTDLGSQSSARPAPGPLIAHARAVLSAPAAGDATRADTGRAAGRAAGRAPIAGFGRVDTAAGSYWVPLPP